MPGPLPLLGLRAFAEVGRAGSVKAAAGTLGVTPGAVSQQVKGLEARLDVQLFERGNRELRLTPVGERLLADVAEAFGRIEDALGAVEQDRAVSGKTLIVSTTASFAATWLVPRLGRFSAREPGVEVRVLTTPALVAVGTGLGAADVAIRHGLGEWSGMQAVQLVRPRFLPVGSPAVLQAGPEIREPSDCLRYKLLQNQNGDDWRLWLQALGADYRDRRAVRGTRLPDATLLIQAAIAGQGLAMVRDIYVAAEIAADRLRVACDAPWPAQFAYYVVTHSGPQRRAPQIGSFTNWLFDEAASSEG